MHIVSYVVSLIAWCVRVRHIAQRVALIFLELCEVNPDEENVTRSEKQISFVS